MQKKYCIMYNSWDFKFFQGFYVSFYQYIMNTSLF